MNIYENINALVGYGLAKELIRSIDVSYTANRLYEFIGIAGQKVNPIETDLSIVEILDGLIDWAVETGRLESKSPDFADLFDSGVMACLMGRPSEVVGIFNGLKTINPESATEYFYQLGIDSNYIRMDRIQKNIVWKSETAYGDLDISINLSKPEKDPKAIAAALSAPKAEGEVYPQCLLCCENEGYQGRLDHPARQNLRLIPLRLNGESWFMQYSPYVYYNEHCIVLSEGHVPMKLTESTLRRLVDFVEIFPHYFIGSNADLPIVGGSILTHDHFQGGHYTFAMTEAESVAFYGLSGFEDLKISRVKWPMSVVRIAGESKERVVACAMKVFETWKGYSDGSVDVLSHTGVVPHNTMTPIARVRDGLFEMDVVLRNNRTSDQYPDGIFHPHQELHHIKKENIGLIEVMGLAVLPGRLSKELESLGAYLTGEKMGIESDPEMEKHLEWFGELQEIWGQRGQAPYYSVTDLIQKEVGNKFMTVLEHAGVFKNTTEGCEAFDRFMRTLS